MHEAVEKCCAHLKTRNTRSSSASLATSLHPHPASSILIPTASSGLPRVRDSNFASVIGTTRELIKETEIRANIKASQGRRRMSPTLRASHLHSQIACTGRQEVIIDRRNRERGATCAKNRAAHFAPHTNCMHSRAHTKVNQTEHFSKLAD